MRRAPEKPPADPGTGRDDAPPGSEDWAKRLRLSLQTTIHAVDIHPESLRSRVEAVHRHEAWRMMNKADGSYFGSFAEFCEYREPWGLGRPWDRIAPFVGALKWFKGKPGEPRPPEISAPAQAQPINDAPARPPLRSEESPARPPLAAVPGMEETPAAPESPPLTGGATIDPMIARWLWRGRLAVGTVAILDGDPGKGKSTLVADLIARVTTGAPMPGEFERREPRDAIGISYEDSPNHVIIPRLMAAGADLSRYHNWDLSRPLVLPDDLDLLVRAVDQVRPALVVIDPLMACLSGEINAHRDSDVRRVMGDIANLAHSRECTILFVRHLNKGGGSNAVYRGGGSIGIIGAARSGLLLDVDPEDPDGRVLAVTKCNLGRIAPSLKLRIVPAPPPIPEMDVARVEWGGEATATADELLEPPEDRTAIDEAVELLRHLLKDGPIMASEGRAAMEANGVSERTDKRARKRLEVIAKRESLKGKWWWYLPEQLASGPTTSS